MLSDSKQNLLLVVGALCATLMLVALGCSPDDDDGVENTGDGRDVGIICGGCPSGRVQVVDSATYCGYRCVTAAPDAGMDVHQECAVCEDDQRRVARADSPCGFVCIQWQEGDTDVIDINPDVPGAEVCNNLVDDDRDGYIDCVDEDCFGVGECPSPNEICDNQIDDDGNGQADCADSACAGHEACSTEYRYLRLEGSSEELTAPYPGADIDAVVLVPAGSGSPVGLSTAVATYNATDIQNGSSIDGILGLVDADEECDLNAPTSFYSLGGTDSFVVGTFGDDVLIRNGDEITVYELGSTECGDGFADESYILSASDASDGTWIEFGTGTGTETVIVSGL